MNDRLLKGARMLGALWHSGKQCQDGWYPRCSCVEKSQFCLVKLQWTALARTDGRTVEDERMIVEAMTAQELLESGMTITLDNGIRIGPAGELTVDEAARMVATPDAIPAILKVLKSFPGARVVRSA